MKALFTSPFFLPFISRGAEIEIRDVATRLRTNGVDVSVLTTKPGRRSKTPSEISGIPVEYVFDRSRGAEQMLAFTQSVTSRIAQSDADLIHCWHYADAAGSEARRPGVPMVLKLTGTVIPDRIKVRKPAQYELLVRGLNAADEVWCNSTYARDAMAGFGIPMRVVPAGITPIDGPAIERAALPTALVAASADDPRKRVEEVIDAWPAVRATVPQARLWIAGQAGRGTINALLKRLPTEHRASVSFPGVLSTKDLQRAYQQAWVVLAPAVHEALGLVTLEGLSAGTPVIGARSGATIELLSGIGTLVDPLDVTGWSAAIAAALQSQPPVRMQECLDATIAFSWDAIVPTYLERYRALLSSS